MKRIIALLLLLVLASPVRADLRFGGTSQGGAIMQGTTNSMFTCTTAGSIWLMFQPNWSYNDGKDHMFFTHGIANGATYFAIRGEKFSDNNFYWGFIDSANGDHRASAAADSSMYTNGTWANHLLTWNTSSGGVTYYVDNSSKANNSATGWSCPDWASQTQEAAVFGNQLLIGVLTVSSCDTNHDCPMAEGNIAEYARWNRVLDSTEKTLLQNGYSPLWIQNGLLEYRSFYSSSACDYGTGSDCQDVTTTQAHNTFGQTTHPVRIYPSVMRRR